MASTGTVDAGARPALRPRSGRFGINLASNVGQLALTMVVGAWYVPFLLGQLGPAAYGLVPLASSVTAYMTLVTLSLNSAVGRSLTLALEKEDHRQANLIFNVSLWGNLVLCTLLLVPSSFAVIYVDRIFHVPPGYESGTRWLFMATVAAFLVHQLKTTFGVSCFARNRLDLDNVVSISETLTRVSVVLGLFAVFQPRIEFVGAAILAGTVVSLVGMIVIWRKLTPALRIRLSDFDWTMLKNLCSTGGWVLVSQCGVMLYLNIDLLVANRLFGPEESGRYAAVLQLPAILRSICIAVGGIFAPTMFQMYARGDFREMVHYLNRAIKFVGLVIALPIGLVCGFAEPLLRLWLGQSFGDLAPLLFLMAIHLCINLAMYPLYSVPLVADRVKVPGLVTLAIGVGNLLLALLLAGTLGWGLYGLAAAGAIMLTLRHLLFTPLYGAHVLNQPARTFYREVGLISIAAVVVVGLGLFISSRWQIKDWGDLCLAGTSVAVLYALFVYLLLTPEERETLKRYAQPGRKGLPSEA